MKKEDAPEPRDIRVPLMLSASEVAAIDEFRFSERIPTRSDAIRRLIEGGLRAGLSGGKAPKPPAKPRARKPETGA